MNENFSRWLDGAPIVPIPTLGDFAEWLDGAPLLDQGASPAPFGLAGIAYMSATIVATGALKGSGTGQVNASVTLTAPGPANASSAAWCTAKASAALGA